MMKHNASMDDAAGLAPTSIGAPGLGADVSGILDVAVLGGALVERRQDPAGLELRLFGRLDRDASDLLGTAAVPVVQVDLTRLDSVDPVALRSLVERQRSEHEAGRQLLLRIAPDQVAALGTTES